MFCDGNEGMVQHRHPTAVPLARSNLGSGRSARSFRGIDPSAFELDAPRRVVEDAPFRASHSHAAYANAGPCDPRRIQGTEPGRGRHPWTESSGLLPLAAHHVTTVAVASPSPEAGA